MGLVNQLSITLEPIRDIVLATITYMSAITKGSNIPMPKVAESCPMNESR